MFPFNRFMYAMQCFVHTCSHSEGYTTDEIIMCCTDYIIDGTSIGLCMSRHQRRLSGKGTKGRKSFTDHEYQWVEKAHFSILQTVTNYGPVLQEASTRASLEEHALNISVDRRWAQVHLHIMVEEPRPSLWWISAKIRPIVAHEHYCTWVGGKLVPPC